MSELICEFMGNHIDDDELLADLPDWLEESDVRLKTDLYWQFIGDEEDDDWDAVCDILTDLMSEISIDGAWVATVAGFGWQNMDGYTPPFHAETGRELLMEVLPQTQCYFRVYRGTNNGRETIEIQNYHHDSPTGNEWYTIQAYIEPEVEED